MEFKIMKDKNKKKGKVHLFCFKKVTFYFVARFYPLYNAF